MTNANEAIHAQTPLGADLNAGTEAISYDQTVTFTKYVRLILPLDGFVFWVKAVSVSPSALLGAAAFNSFAFNESPGLVGVDSVPELTAKGSLHFGTDVQQDEDANFSINRVLFTSEQHVQGLNDIGPNIIYIAHIEGIRFAFSSRGTYYKQSNTWHYSGNAVYSTMASQIIDDPRTLPTSLIVSNSLPAWLNINYYAPAWPVLIPFPAVPIFPSYLASLNLQPPFISVHIGENDTEALQAAPHLDRQNGSHYLLAKDRVGLTFYGMNNAAIMDWQDAMTQYTRDAMFFGLMNMPVPRDDKKSQPELLTLAMKKRMSVDVSYNQYSMRNIAQQIIKSCIVDFSPQPRS